MEILDAIQANLLSPAVLFFALGLIAAITKTPMVSTLRCPVLLAMAPRR